MRVKLMMAGVLAVSMLGTPAAFAQAAAAGAGADTTCSDFVAMDATGQANLLAQLGGGESSNSGSSGGATAASGNDDQSGDLGSGDAAAGGGAAGAATSAGAGAMGSTGAGSMDSAAVLAACQTNPSLTVGEALSGGASK